MKIKLTLILLLQALALLSQDTESYNSWSENVNSGVQDLNMQYFDSAESKLENAYKIAKSIFEENSEELSTTAYYYAVVLVQSENNKKAQEPMEKAVEAFKLIYGETSEQYATGITVLANIYIANKNYKLAEAKYLESINLSKNSYGEEHYMYGVTLTNLAGFYREIGNNKKALEILNKGLDILKDNPEFDQVYYDNLRYNNLPEIYEGLGRLEESLELHEESLSYIKNNFGEYTSNYANILTSIGGLNVHLGKFNKAEKALEEAAFIFEELDNIEDDEALGNTYMFLAACYLETSDYEKALYYINVGTTLTKLDSNPPPINALNYYEIISSLYWELGDYNQAKEYVQKSIDGTKVTVGLKAPKLPVLISYLGMCNRELGETDEAIKLTQEAFSMAKELNYTIKDKEYRQCLNNLSAILIDQNKYEEAIENYKSILEEENKAFPNYWLDALSLADVYLINNQCDEAIDILEETVEKIKHFYGKEDPNYISSLNTLILAQNCIKKYGKTLPNIEEANQLTKNQLLRKFSFSTENLKYFFLEDLEHSFNVYQSVNLELKNNNLTVINLDNQLLLKGLLLNQSKNITEKLAELNDEIINAQIDEYKNNKQLLNRLEDKKESVDKEQISKLQSAISVSEIELVQLYNEKFKNPIDFDKSWKDVQGKLKKNEVAIEFSRFDYISNKYSDSTYYLAYIIKKDKRKPEVIKLFEEKQLVELLASSSTNSQSNKSRGSKAESTSSNDNTKSIYNLIWKPIEPFLSNIETIYYAPSGKLHNVSFARLTSDDGYLINKYNLHQLSSTYEIAEGFEQPKLEKVLLMGGIDYEYLNVNNESFKNESIDLVDINTEIDRGQKWDYLPGTLSEIENLESLLLDKNIEILKGSKATEMNFKSLNKNSPDIIHIATHGFFFEDKKERNKTLTNSYENIIFRSAYNPLKRSGLLLSGANYAWQNGNNPFEIDNGILTAEEISTLDLSNTKMVVLSACETGLGDIDGSEGVYGLQRAFKMAGIDIIVMSLWEVPDKETAEFMNQFYGNWVSGIDVREAFNKTQRSMADKYSDSTEKWAGFVLFE